MAALVTSAAICSCSSAPLRDVTASAIPIDAVGTVAATNGALRLSLSVTTRFPEDIPAFVYQDQIGDAPTIHVRPGDTLYITLNNKLPYTNSTANAVNLHFHGLSVSPAEGQDNAMVLAGPTQSLQYALHIPASQQPGLYWYHSHSHGEAYWQVTSGISGALIVDGLEQRVPQLRGMKQTLLILRDAQDWPNIEKIPWYARAKVILGQRALARKVGINNYGPTDPDDVTPGRHCESEAGLVTTIEGTQNGALSLSPGERQLFRVLNAAAGRVFDLAVDGERLGLVAVDGYALNAYPGTPSIAWVDHIVLPAGGRAEFIVTGQERQAILRSRCFDAGPLGDRNPEIALAKLTPGASSTGRKQESPAAVATGAADRSNTASIPLAKPVVQRRVIFTEDNNGYYINHERFTMSRLHPMFLVKVGTLEEWVIENETPEVHALHIHQVHFAVLKTNGRDPALRYWQDTVIVPAEHREGPTNVPGTVTILVDFRNPIIRGDFPLHCHMLDHEDGGMMAMIRAEP
jgi:suppressor of ftsI